LTEYTTRVKLSGMQVQQVMKISGKGQVVIPATIRDKYGWQPGTKVVVKKVRPTEMVLSKKPGKLTLAEKYCGSMKGRVPSIKELMKSKKEELKLEE
jgi:AbrB family looped-hinge helix DNA binding protein